MRRPAILLALLLAAHPAPAAQIEVTRHPKANIVLLAGEIRPDDGEAFARAAASLDNAFVFLHSPGGNVVAGLRIGQLIRERGFHTVVLDRSICASACGLVWLAGKRRLMQPAARIGFHAAYVVRRGRPRESGVGNALIGAYLSRLGLPDRAIVYISSSAPNDMRWLTRADADRLGLDIVLVPSDPPETPQPAARDGGPKLPEAPDPPAPRGPPPTIDQRAAAFAGHYFATWSETNERALAAFARYYAPQVAFYGGPLDRTELIRRKQDFANRWPERIYAVRAPSLLARCNQPAQTCTVAGIVDWDTRSAPRQARSVGAARFELELDLSRDPPVILSETGTVITRDAWVDAR